MILIIDHYDSFVASLARYVECLGGDTHIIRQDSMSVDAVLKLGAQAIILSPGPGTPDEAGMSLALTARAAGKVAMLGVCLGHQIIAQALGAQLIHSHPAHGVASAITHDAQGIFEGIPNPMQAGRYHALAIAKLPACLRATAYLTQDNNDKIVMGFAHVTYPLWGVQFHPESILTPHGARIIENFLNLALCAKQAAS